MYYEGVREIKKVWKRCFRVSSSSDYNLENQLFFWTIDIVFDYKRNLNLILFPVRIPKKFLWISVRPASCGGGFSIPKVDFK